MGCQECVASLGAQDGCEKDFSLKSDCKKCEADLVGHCTKMPAESALVVDGVVAGSIADDCIGKCQHKNFRWRIDFKDNGVFTCTKYLGTMQCNQVNLYFVFNKGSIGKGPNDYEFVNLDFQATNDSIGVTRRNIVQSTAHTKVTYALQWTRETELDGSEETVMYADQVRYGEQPDRKAPYYIKASFSIPTKSGKAVWTTAKEQLAFNLNQLWTSIIATSSLVGGLFMFFFPNIMHKSYFRFADWRPDVESLDEQKVAHISNKVVREHSKSVNAAPEFGGQGIEMADKTKGDDN